MQPGATMFDACEKIREDVSDNTIVNTVVFSQK